MILLACAVAVCMAVALICSLFALKLSADVKIEVEAMKRSTHQITYIDPTKQNFSDFSSEVKENLTKSDNLETLI